MSSLTAVFLRLLVAYPWRTLALRTLLVRERTVAASHARPIAKDPRSQSISADLM